MAESSKLYELRAPAEVTIAKPTEATWLYVYLGVQFATQLALLVPALAPGRIVFRIASFGTSLLFLWLIPRRSVGFELPRSLLIASLVVIGLSGLNPEGGGLLASVAHWSFHLAIIGPVFWVTRLELDSRCLEKVLLLLWSFSTASALAGVLQAVFPGNFQPSLSTILAERGPDYVSGMSIRLASGEWILRPMGLTDVPGGAAAGGFYAMLIGVGVIMTRPFPGARALGVVATVAGITCIYLSQVRAMLVMLAVSLLTLAAVLGLANRLGRVVGVLAISAALMLGGVSVAFSIGGTSVTNRLQTLTDGAAASTYYKSRGIFLEHTFGELISEYPLGAGLGRWGMMSTYFGDAKRALWAEIQWTGWLFDGGIMLIVLYPLAVLVAFWNAVKIARESTDENLGMWAALVAAYDVGTLALVFSYPVFMSGAGLEFWLLNAVLARASLRKTT